MNFSVKNFKCFEDTTVPLQQLTVLAGGNSVGKSSVVQALLLVRFVIETFKGSESWYSFFEGKNIVFPPRSFSLNGPFLLNLGTVEEVWNKNAYEEIISFTFEENGSKLTMVFSLPEDKDTYSLLFKGIKREGELISFASLDNLSFYYLNAERLGPRLRHDVEDLPYLHTGWQGEYAVQIIGSKKTEPVADDRCFDKDEVKNLMHQSRLWLNAIVGDVEIDDANLIRGIKSAEISFGATKSKPTNVGFGISYVLPIIVNGLVARKNSMFIVENPEAHLHPSGQSQIGRFLAKIAASGVQVVVETHSEHVINGIRISSMNGTISAKDIAVNFFKKNETGQAIIQSIGVNDAGDLTAYPKGFFDQEQRDFAEIVRLKRQMGSKM